MLNTVPARWPLRLVEVPPFHLVPAVGKPLGLLRIANCSSPIAPPDLIQAGQTDTMPEHDPEPGKWSAGSNLLLLLPAR